VAGVKVPAPDVIIALDVGSTEAALAVVDRLPECRFYKVGSELFTREGPAVVRALVGRGAEVFLDLKFHDIPNTVGRACRAAAELGARLLTVHASGGDAMLRAAVEGAGDRCGVLGVTVLTSLDAAAVGAAWGREGVEVEREVLRLAGLARRAGAHGVVCSGREAAAVRQSHDSALAILVPGIRMSGGATHDQSRTVTPAEAARNGARYLVVGRAVTAAADPEAAFAAMRRELVGTGTG
jgi:orotidine-5'-phosphate decarboxylase